MASESGYQVMLVDRPAIAAAGFMVKTTMQKAATDCPNLWKMFEPHMKTFPVDHRYPGESYGVSVNTDMKTGAFEYWAAMPLEEGAELPRGMKTVQLPAGTYCACALPGLDDIGPAFAFLEKEWLPSQGNYEFDTAEGVFYELYTAAYMKTGELAVYTKVRRKD